MAEGAPTDSSGREIDVPTGQATTGHEWDGIKELDTPMPRWWLWTFYGTILWSLVYVVLYPAWPMVDRASKGVLDWSSRQAVAEDIAAVADTRRVAMDAIRSLPLETIRQDDSLRPIAIRGGQAAFKVNCVPCHGADAAGSPGYPNLNDDEWIWGGTLEEIYASLAHGIRFDADEDTRFSEMPAFGVDGLLDAAQVASVTEHVLALSGQAHDAKAAVAGSTVYAENCAACHGAVGEGSRELGAPALNDAIALYGRDREAIYTQIWRPQHGVMPAWGQRLDAATMKQLAIYVHGLGGGAAADDGAR